MSHDPNNTHVRRAMDDIDESRNERQKCVLLCALGRQLREISHALVSDAVRLRDEALRLRNEALGARHRQ